MSQMPKAVFHPGQQVNGFVIRRVQPVEELRSVAYEMDHPQSGARLLHLHNEDGENLFSVTFTTPPPDDSGVPHILEHAVLGGSAKYAVKDPFFEMIKCSMATFINAMTGSDYTVYPVASNVKRDFYNLADVYWDAVFHPTLSELTFGREGHHLELAAKGDLDSDLIIKGIVYNEMKGARSSPESLVMDRVEKSLWPDTPYGKDSGGDPERLPELTYQQFKRFHETYYHPGNAHIFLYGDIPTAEHLDFLAPRLNVLSRRPPAGPLPLQPRWKESRHLTDRYPTGPADPTANKTFVCMNWLVGDGLDVRDTLELAALDLILLGNQAAPLRKALIDSHLGEDIFPAGMWANGRESSFHIGLKGTEADRAAPIEKLILQTLESIAAAPVPTEQAHAAFQQLAYRQREIGSMFPLRVMGKAVHLWMHGADPLDALHAGSDLDALKARYSDNPAMFGDLIRQRLLNNPHRITLTVAPDTKLQQQKEAELTERMRKLKQSLSRDQLQSIAARQEELDAALSAPSSPAALAALPQLKVRDLPSEPREIATRVHNENNLTLLRNDVFANGVNYLAVSFDLSGLPHELWAYLPLYTDCVGKMGAAGMDYAAMAQRVAAHTGGVGFSHAAQQHMESAAAPLRRGTFSTKFLDEKVGPALDVLRDLMYSLDCADRPRLSDVLGQARSHHRSRPPIEGLSIALRHAGRAMTPEGRLNELWQGVPQTRLIERLAAEASGVIEKLAAITGYLKSSGRPVVSFTGSDVVWEKVRVLLSQWTATIAAPAEARTTNDPSKPAVREGLAAPMSVAYCATVFPAPKIHDPAAPILAVGNRLVSFDYVLEEVRFKGTAYGGGCAYNPMLGIWEFHSYRDPWIWRTLDVYQGALDFVRRRDWSQADVDRAIIGTAKEFERPIRPGEATGNALWRYLCGDTPLHRKQRHAAMLGATVARVKNALLEVFEAGFAKSQTCVVSSREKLEEANRQRPQSPLEIEDILPA